TKCLDKVPEAVWSGLTPSVKHLRVFGSLCHRHTSDKRRQNLDDKSEALILVGYHTTESYRLYNPITKRTTISRNVKVSEKEQWNWGAASTRSEQALLHAEKKPIAVEWVHKVKHVPDGSSAKARPVTRELSQKSDTDSKEMLCQSGVTTNAEARCGASVHSVPEFQLESLAPVARLETVRPVMEIASQVNWQSVQLDVKSVVENSKLEKEVYVEQPQGFKVEGAEDKAPKEQEDLELMIDILTKLLNIERFKDLKKMLKVTSLEHLNKG
ncbi:cysteine-rich receptor-like protein kinase 25-like protein, partial [Trifolium pratense]